MKTASVLAIVLLILLMLMGGVGIVLWILYSQQKPNPPTEPENVKVEYKKSDNFLL